MADERIFTDLEGDTLTIDVVSYSDEVWLNTKFSDTGEVARLVFRRDTVCEMVDWLATRLDNKKILS